MTAMRSKIQRNAQSADMEKNQQNVCVCLTHNQISTSHMSQTTYCYVNYQLQNILLSKDGKVKKS